MTFDPLHCDYLYVLEADGETPRQERDLMAWSLWMEGHRAELQLAEDLDEGHDGNPATRIRISTRFMATEMDVGNGILGEPRPPLLWETAAFGPPVDADGVPSILEVVRYRSHAAAMAGHQEVCLRIRAGRGKFDG